jgi:hypothetical protein
MNVFTYVIDHDLGFAPNPFHGVCTLACCKPRIRKKAELGDIVLGTGAVMPQLRGHLTYWMQVDEITTFDVYWRDHRFRHKKPVMKGTTVYRYGDNIYHRDGQEMYRQEYSFHSLEDGAVSGGDLRRDTGTTDKVLIGRNFAFWGKSGPVLPKHLSCFVRRERHLFSEEQKNALMQWLATRPERGYIDEPAHWQFLGRQKTKKAKKAA